jgi:DNA-binding CsgD family transcriptional regulator
MGEFRSQEIKSDGVNALPIQTGNHTDVFTALDRAYGLIDGSASWPDCLEALTDIPGLDVAKLMLYDCGRCQSRVVEAAGIEADRSRLLQNQDIDEALWRSAPGAIWLPSGNGAAEAFADRLLGYSVLDRDSLHILYLECRGRRVEASQVLASKHILQTVLPHFHRACRLHRSITGDDLGRFAAPDLKEPAPAAGLPIELRLRRRFKLSKAEARVATLLADGLSPRMIADRLNVSIHTVRSQLQAIFSKTETSRQAELTSLILKETEVPRAVCQTGSVRMNHGERSPCP